MSHTDDKPSIFISHKHVDSTIADTLRIFFTMQSGGRARVYQSSSPWADAPKFGRNLNKQLMAALWHTNLVILIYTNRELDWGYCMWECGVALNPQSPDTRIILLQCADSSPALFAEQVNVNARSFPDIQKFTNEFLTSPDFFPGSCEPITKFSPNGQEVANAAAELFEKLTSVLPAPPEGPSEEWPAYPFLQLEIDLLRITNLRDLKHENRVKLVYDETRIAGADVYCWQLFGMPSFPHDMSFKQLLDNWKSKHPDASPKWIESIVMQLTAGAMWEFPPQIWERMEGSDKQYYLPMLIRVRKLPSSKCMQFDVYFCKWPIGA